MRSRSCSHSRSHSCSHAHSHRKLSLFLFLYFLNVMAPVFICRGRAAALHNFDHTRCQRVKIHSLSRSWQFELCELKRECECEGESERECYRKAPAMCACRLFTPGLTCGPKNCPGDKKKAIVRLESGMNANNCKCCTCSSSAPQQTLGAVDERTTWKNAVTAGSALGAI
jgi:hypothetical protein